MNRVNANRKLSVVGGRNREQKPKKVERPTHDMALAACIRQRGTIELTMKNGDVISGHINAFDQWTITIDNGADRWPTTVYKHDISSFTRTDQRPC